MTNYYVCLDVGGTEIKAAPVSETGALLKSVRNFSADASRSRREILDRFLEIIRSCFPENGTLLGLRFGFPGPFDYTNGICLMQGLDKYDALYQFDLKTFFADTFHLSTDEIRFCNDVSAFALGELFFGQAGNTGKSLFVCIGTGCGSAFSLNGRLAGSEIPGVPENGYIYPTPFHGSTIDACISKRGLMGLTRQRLGTALEGRELSRLCREGNREAIACFLEFGEWIVEALSPFLDSFHPNTLCIGGGITRSADLFLEALQQACSVRGIQFYVTADTSERAIRGCSTL